MRAPPALFERRVSADIPPIGLVATLAYFFLPLAAKELTTPTTATEHALILELSSGTTWYLARSDSRDSLLPLHNQIQNALDNPPPPGAPLQIPVARDIYVVTGNDNIVGAEVNWRPLPVS